MCSVNFTKSNHKRVPWVKVQRVDTSARQKSGSSVVKWSTEGHKEDIIRRARPDDWVCSSLNALQLVAVAVLGNKPVSGVTRAESEQRDPVLLQIRRAW